MSTFQLKHILCPVDFSPHSAAALRIAGGMAGMFGAAVVVLHAQRLEAPEYFTKAQVQALKSHLRKSARAGRELGKKFADQHLPADVEHRVVLLEEDAVEAVLHVQKDLRAELIVMGTHGRTGLARMRLGSVTESVLRQVRVPVLTVGPKIRPAASLAKIRRILCPVNYSDLAQMALDHAAVVAARSGAELVVAHVVEPGADEEGRDWHQELCDWVDPAVRSHCTVKEVVRKGTAVEQIVAEAGESRPDLIVLGAHPRSFLGTILFGSTTELVIRNAPCPVLSVIHK